MKKEKLQGLNIVYLEMFTIHQKNDKESVGGSKNQMFTKLSKNKEGRPYTLEGGNQGGI